MVIREQDAVEQTGTVELVIYVSPHCQVCAYAYEVADDIRRRFPDVNMRIVDLEKSAERIPERVFATPTYLLNGRVWSLGNPSPTMVTETFGELSRA